jgi:hypothetical protein
MNANAGMRCVSASPLVKLLGAEIALGSAAGRQFWRRIDCNEHF